MKTSFVAHLLKTARTEGLGDGRKRIGQSLVTRPHLSRYFTLTKELFPVQIPASVRWSRLHKQRK